MNLSQSSVLKILRNRYVKLEHERLELQQAAADAQRMAKQAIFALQRNEKEKASSLIRQAKAILSKVKKAVAKKPRLECDASWRAAQEEYCEAVFFERAVNGKPLFRRQDLNFEPSIVIGALSDLVGELVRLAVNCATRGERKKVEQIHGTAEALVSYISSLDLTGNLRSKGDQARQHLRRLEDIRYDLSRRG